MRAEELQVLAQVLEPTRTMQPKQMLRLAYSYPMPTQNINVTCGLGWKAPSSYSPHQCKQVTSSVKRQPNLCMR